MNDKGSNASVPENISRNQSVYDNYTNQLVTRLAKLNVENKNTAAIPTKDSQSIHKHHETAAEDEYETSETTAEGETVSEEDETTIEENEEEENEACTEVTLPTEVSIPKNKKQYEYKMRVQINEENVQRSKNVTEALENYLVITGRHTLVTKDQEEVKGTSKSSLKLEARASPSFKKIRGELVAVIGVDHSIGMAQEPWPKDVKLYQPYEVEQILLPDNANCLAVQAFLRMCNLDFEVVSRANAEFMSPSGKVPFIRCGAFVVSELEGIVQFVNNKGISLTTNMEPEQKSDMRAYMSLVHNVLENAELYLCWCDRETYNEVTKPRNGSVYPWPLNYFQTWSKKAAVSKRLKMMGWYNKSLEDVFQEVENCCQALTDRLEGKEYFFGKNHTEMDAIVYGHICSILSMPVPADGNRLAYLVQDYEKLTDHCRRIHKQVMKQDHILVVTKSSKIIDSENDTETEINLPSDSEALLEGEDDEDIDT